MSSLTNVLLESSSLTIAYSCNNYYSIFKSIYSNFNIIIDDDTLKHKQDDNTYHC